MEHPKIKYIDLKLIRYLFVGAFNTFFGYTLFAVLTYILSDFMQYGYIVANIISNIISITVAYIGYKVFVFKTRGNYLREYLRFYAVYGSAALINILLLPILVTAITSVIPQKEYAPYIGGALLTGITVLCSFVGHNKFSFKA